LLPFFFLDVVFSANVKMTIPRPVILSEGLCKDKREAKNSVRKQSLIVTRIAFELNPDP
jgi:hypothetical protein